VNAVALSPGVLFAAPGPVVAAAAGNGVADGGDFAGLVMQMMDQSQAGFFVEPVVPPVVAPIVPPRVATNVVAEFLAEVPVQVPALPPPPVVTVKIQSGAGPVMVHRAPRAQAPPVKAEDPGQAPAVAVVVPVFELPAPVRLKPVPFDVAPSGGAPAQTESHVESLPSAPAPPPALELTIHAPDVPSAPAPVALKIASPPAMPQHVPAEISSPPVVHAPVTMHTHSPQMHAVKPEAPPAAPTLVEAPEPPEEPKQQPIRSVSIEFTPDGAQDVRLRLSEHSGEVHISLHTTDPSLTGRLNDGVQGLVETLSMAGYDAQAWTPEQGRQHQRQQEQPDKQRRQGSPASRRDDFGDLMQQPVKEIS
jgi:hypothetical protein